MAQYIQVDFTDTEGTAYKIEVHDDTYTGIIYQVQGKAVLDYPKSKTMNMLRGSSLKMQLEASSTDTWQQRLVDTVGDKKISVILYKSGVVFWRGFIKPDGIYESFVSDYWIINIQAIDGLGLLENIKFLDTLGLPYQGSVGELEILARCLELTGQTMNFRLYDLNLYFSVDDTDPTLTEEALIATYVNTDRYFKEDNPSSVFTAKEVLESILKKYGAFVTQQGDMWHIVRIIEYFTDTTSLSYHEYLIDGTEDSTGSIDPQQVLGSEINSFDPFHAGGNQQKNYLPSLGAYKVFYKYGTVVSILENPKIYFNDGVGDIDGWTTEAALSNYTFTFWPAIPLWPSGYYDCQMKAQTSNILALSYDHATYDNDVEDSDALKIEVIALVNYDVNVQFGDSALRQKFKVTLIGDSGTSYYLHESGEWTLTTADIVIYKYKWLGVGPDRVGEQINTLTVNTDGLPEDGTITVQFYFPYVSNATDNGSYSIIKDININQAPAGLKGESHTGTRISNATSVIDIEDKISVGDNESDTFIGAIEDSSAENTLRWSKAPGGTIDASKQWAILNWMVRDRLTISSGNATIFSGGVYGYLPYLGVLSIDNVDGVFMCVKWSYDLKRNLISASWERIFQDDIYSDIYYSFAFEGENVIRPAIE